MGLELEKSAILSKDLAVGGCSLLRLFEQDDRVWVEKTLLPKYQARPEFESLIQNEFDLLSELAHPLVIKPISLGQSEVFHSKKSYVLHLPYVEGPVVSSWLSDLRSQEADFRRGQARRLLYQMVSAYTYLHREKQIVHGDVAPENILIGQEGMIRLIDFSLSHRAGTEARSPFKIGGRSSFRAPEMIESFESSVQTDVFSVGRIFEEAIGSLAEKQDRKWIGLMLSERSLPDRREILKRALSETSLDLLAWSPGVASKALAPTAIKGLPPKPWALRSPLLGLVGLVTMTSFCPSGLLQINTLPPSAVELGGRFYGETPLTYLELPIGEYRLSLKVGPTGEAYSQQIEVGSGSRLKFFEDFRNIDNLR